MENTIDYYADNYLNLDEHGNWRTDVRLHNYYKPEKLFMCCFALSKSKADAYADGYGLNFYTAQYGYYEYDGCYGQR